MAVMNPARVVGGLVIGVLAAVAAGCDDGKPAGSVSGTVIYNGTPVTAGAVNFVSKSGAAAVATIDDAGKYAVDGKLEAGEYTVYVTPPEPPDPVPGVAPAPPKAFPVPPKFRAAATSGVTVTVKPGTNADVTVDLKG